MSSRRVSVVSLLLLLAFIAPFTLTAFKDKRIAESAVQVQMKRATSGYNYTILYKNKLKLDVTLKRPDRNDPNILLCIPGAYTLLTDYTVDGLYIDNGKVYNKDHINHSLGGAIEIVNGDCSIFPTQKGKLLNDSLIRLVTAQKGSLFQQIQRVEHGVGAKYKDIKLFQRRAIVKMKDGQTAVIESYEHITLAAFTKDLLELGVQDALYTDMGAWDEGWYKGAGGAVVTIGRMRTQTDKQSNWVVFKAN